MGKSPRILDPQCRLPLLNLLQYVQTRWLNWSIVIGGINCLFVHPFVCLSLLSSTFPYASVSVSFSVSVCLCLSFSSYLSHIHTRARAHTHTPTHTCTHTHSLSSLSPLSCLIV